MLKRPKRPRDPNQLAKLILDIATGKKENVKPTAPKARAKKLSARRRKTIARKAAKARWR